MQIAVSLELPPREPYEVVAGLGATGASARGSTYARRVQSCAREHLISNLLRWEPIRRPEPLDFGLLWHGMLEVYYQQVLERQQGRPIPELPATAAYRFLQRFRDAEGWRSFYERASTMLEVYLDRWRHADDYWQILAVEYTCGWTAATHPQLVAQAGFELTTRLDLLVVDHTVPTAPLTRHIEHKSAHSLDVTTVMVTSEFGRTMRARFEPEIAAASLSESSLSFRSSMACR